MKRPHGSAPFVAARCFGFLADILGCMLRRCSITAALLISAYGWAETLPELAPTVRGIFPLGARRGETVEVVISGRHLDGALELDFARPEIQAQILSSDFFSIKARVSIPLNVPAGLQDFRLRTRLGSYVGVFHVGSLPEQRETEPNNDLAHAQSIVLPTLINGVVNQGDYDLFRFRAEAGQKILLDLMATRAASRLDATIAVLDERGNELDFIDDYYIHKDPYLAFVVKTTGDYFVRVAGSAESGSPFSSYRLVVGAVPHMLQVLPAGARRGSTGEFRISGLNLQNVDRLVFGDSLAEGKVTKATAESVTFRLTIPASVPRGQYSLHAFAGSMEVPLPIGMLITDVEERISTPASTRANPELIRPPVALSGVLDRRRAAHFFSFEARAGERFEFDVGAMKLGYLVDPVIALYDLDGSLLAFADDRLQQNGSQPPDLDPYLVYTFQKAGRYLVQLRDSAERGDPNYVYHLGVRPIHPDFELRALAPSITLYRGRTVFLPARVRRNGGWDTPVEVWARDLPRDVHVDTKTAEPKDTIVKDNCALDRRLDGTDVLVPFHVTADAPLGTFPIHLRARGAADGKPVEHDASIFYLWESVGKVTGAVQAQELMATVVDLPSVVLDPPENVTLTPGKVSRLRVLVSRFDDDKTPLTIEPDPPLAGATFENNVLSPEAGQIELRITATGAVKSGSFRLRAGSAVSPPIEIKNGSARSSEDPE